MIDFKVQNIYTEACGIKNYPKLFKVLEAYAPGYKYTYQYKRRIWDGKTTLFQGDYFPTGLLPVILDAIHKAPIQIRYTITDQRTIKNINLHTSPVQLRPYQEDAVNKALTNTYLDTWWPRGVLQVATGGGKTEMAADIIYKTRVPTLFLVHRRDLETQAVERFQKYGIDVGTLDDLGQKQVIVSTVQSLTSCVMEFKKYYKTSTGEKKVRDDAWLEEKRQSQAARENFIRTELLKMEQVFIDEAHLVAAKLENSNLFTKALSWVPNAYMRWGLTATPFMRDQLHNWMLEGATGPVIVKITNRELIEQGYLTEAKVDMYEMNCVGGPTDWPACYTHCISHYGIRNDKVIACAKNYPGPTLILVSAIGQGTLLEAAAKKVKLKIPFASGKTSKTERLDLIKQLNAGKIDGIIASTIWDEGIDLPVIKTVILAGGGKSDIKNLQRLGRGLRLSDNKAQLNLVDFFDRYPRILHKHSETRFRLWRDQGFKVSIIK